MSLQMCTKHAFVAEQNMESHNIFLTITTAERNVVTLSGALQCIEVNTKVCT